MMRNLTSKHNFNRASTHPDQKNDYCRSNNHDLIAEAREELEDLEEIYRDSVNDDVDINE